MKNKNVIVLVLDGLPYEILQDSKNRKSPAKFLNKLKSECLNFQNAYSQGPYTESAVMGLLYGRDTLDNFGYWCNELNSDENILSLSAKNRPTFISYYASFMDKKLPLLADYSYITNQSNPYFSRFIKSKLDWYYEIGYISLTENDLILIYAFLEDIFDIMRTYVNEDYLQHDKSIAYNPYNAINLDDKKWIDEVNKEFRDFEYNKNLYVKRLFESYETHFLIKSCDLEKRRYRQDVVSFKAEILQEGASVFKKMNKKNRKYAIKNNFPPLCEILKYTKGIFTNDKKLSFEYFYRVYINMFEEPLKKMISTNLDQVASSAYSYIANFIDWKEKIDEPYFAYLHFDEYHRPVSFLTHEGMGAKLLREELTAIDNYISNIKEGYIGNLYFDSALLYLDRCIEKLFRNLEENNELDNTTIIITADHGISNSGIRYRKTSTNNFYDETYHIPLIIYDKTIKPKTNTNYVWSKDIARTILELENIDIPDSFSGISIINNNAGRNYAKIEYLGTGVPDLFRKPILFGYRDKKINLIFEVFLFKNFNEGKLIEVYNLEKDPLEYHNIVNQVNKDDYAFFIGLFENRYNQLKNNIETYLDNLRKKYDL